jgi:hypothetical protein
MQRTDLQLEKEKEKITEKSKKSRLTEKIEEYNSLSTRKDDLSSDNSYQVFLNNLAHSTSTNIRRTRKAR